MYCLVINLLAEKGLCIIEGDIIVAGKKVLYQYAEL